MQTEAKLDQEVVILMADKKKMTVVQLTIITAVNMMGSGIIMLPSKLAQVGTMSVIFGQLP